MATEGVWSRSTRYQIFIDGPWTIYCLCRDGRPQSRGIWRQKVGGVDVLDSKSVELGHGLIIAIGDIAVHGVGEYADRRRVG